MLVQRRLRNRWSGGVDRPPGFRYRPVGFQEPAQRLLLLVGSRSWPVVGELVPLHRLGLGRRCIRAVLERIVQLVDAVR